MTGGAPYRLPPPVPPPACAACRRLIEPGTPRYERRGGVRVCKSCFLGEHHPWVVVAVATLTAGAFQSSAALLACGALVLGLGALAVHRGEG